MKIKGNHFEIGWAEQSKEFIHLLMLYINLRCTVPSYLINSFIFCLQKKGHKDKI